jgi:hypothetical protein
VISNRNFYHEIIRLLGRLTNCLVFPVITPRCQLLLPMILPKAFSFPHEPSEVAMTFVTEIESGVNGAYFWDSSRPSTVTYQSVSSECNCMNSSNASLNLWLNFVQQQKWVVYESILSQLLGLCPEFTFGARNMRLYPSSEESYIAQKQSHRLRLTIILPHAANQLHIQSNRDSFSWQPTGDYVEPLASSIVQRILPRTWITLSSTSHAFHFVACHYS